MSRLSPSFASFVLTQFLGAFNDNLFKQLVLLLAAGLLFPGKDLQGVALGIFALPFILFSGLAGDLSERFGKRHIMVLMKWAEVGIMGAGLLALQLRSWPGLLVVLFVMGSQSAIFGPSKYGAIPELVAKEDLIRANGLTTMTTFVAVLIGVALGGLLLDGFGDRLWVTGLICVGIAGLGTFTATRIEKLKATTPTQQISRSPFGSMFQTITFLRRDRGLWSLVLLNSAFYFNAAVVQSTIVGLGADSYLNVPEGEKKLIALVQASLSVAVGVGAVLAPKLAKRFHAGRLSATAALLMLVGQLAFNLVGTVYTLDNGGLWLMHAVAIWVGVTGAIMVVPITSYLQFAPPEGQRGKTFGVTNFMNFVFIFLSAAHYQVFRLPAIDLSPALALTASGVLMLAMLVMARAPLKRLEIV